MTNNGQDRLLSAEENCADLVEPPNDLELNRAVTRKMNHLLCVVCPPRQRERASASWKQTGGEKWLTPRR